METRAEKAGKKFEEILANEENNNMLTLLSQAGWKEECPDPDYWVFSHPEYPGVVVQYVVGKGYYHVATTDYGSRNENGYYETYSGETKVVEEEPTYKILRMYQRNHPSIVIETGLSLKEAREYCSHLETSSKGASTPSSLAHTKEFGPWFDGFEKEE